MAKGGGGRSCSSDANSVGGGGGGGDDESPWGELEDEKNKWVVKAAALFYERAGRDSTYFPRSRRPPSIPTASSLTTNVRPTNDIKCVYRVPYDQTVKRASHTTDCPTVRATCVPLSVERSLSSRTSK